MKLMKEVGITELAKREEEYGIAVNYKQQDLLTDIKKDGNDKYYPMYVIR